MKKIMIALSMALLSSAVWSQQQLAQPKHPQAGELASEQVEAIRRIGQGVLGAKRSYTPPAALSATRAELEALKGAIDKAQSVVWNPSAPTAVTLQNAAAKPQADAEKDARAEKDQETRHVQEKQDMDTHLESLRARHAELDADAAKNQDGEEQALERGASDKLLELEKELADANAAPEAERFERLGKLREKLTPQTQLSLTDHATETPTPTITTIVEHRR